MDQVVSIIKAVKNPFNLSVLVILLFATALLSGVEVEVPKWLLIIGVLFVWLIVLILEPFKENKLLKASNSDDKVSVLQKEIDQLKCKLSASEKELSKRARIIDRYEERRNEVRSYFSSSEDYLLDDVIQKFNLIPENVGRENSFREIVGLMESEGELYHYFSQPGLRLKHST